MARKCIECGESGDRAHLPHCSFAPPCAEREEFIQNHAVLIVRQLEDKIRRQAKVLTAQMRIIRGMQRELNEVKNAPVNPPSPPDFEYRNHFSL